MNGLGTDAPLETIKTTHLAEGDPTHLEWSRQQGHAPEVIDFKTNIDGAIAFLQRERLGKPGSVARCYSIALTELESACMWAVKGMTTPTD